MNFFKLSIIFLFSVLFFIVHPLPVLAQQKNVVLVNPIRGQDFWTHNFSLTETPKKQYELIRANNFPATWLVRYDGLVNKEVQDFLKSLDGNQDTGIFFEITPTLAKDAGVTYNPSANWHQAKSVLLTGYSPEDRVKLIDTAMIKYNELFGKNPKSVGAWWIDAYSLGYMKDKYGIEANLDVSDQYTTDGYQVWGQYWSTPFYPSKLNALVPAQSEEQKLGIITMQWATRDPLNGYGNGVFESTYSVQANDYILHELGSDYFEKLLNIYPQTTVGLENDFDFKLYGAEYANQIQAILKLKSAGSVAVYSMAEYAQKYLAQNPGLSPEVLIYADDPLGGFGKVVWFMNKNYRAGLFFSSEGVVMRDLRFYNSSNKEDCFDKKCVELKLAFSQSSAIDEGNFNSKWIIDDSPATEVSLKQTQENVEIKYKTLAGIEKTIIFLSNDIKVGDEVFTIPVAVMKALNNQQVSVTEKSFESALDPDVLINLIPETTKFLILVLLFFVIPGFIFSKNWAVIIASGIAVFSVFAFILGYVGNLSPVFESIYWFWVLPLAAVIFEGKSISKVFTDFRIKKPSIQTLTLSLLILAGSFIWCLTSIKNGTLFNYGYGFWGPNGHDMIWHLSLISELQKNIPPQNPIYAGTGLNNYHYFYDLLIAKSSQVLGINVLDLVFRFFPILISLLAGILIYQLTFKISKSFTASFWSVFFLYFGGSLGWIVSYFRKGDFGGETMFWGQQSISTLLNPPFAISLVILLAGLNVFYDLKQNWKIRSLIAIVLLLGSLIEFKAYGGILILASLFFISLEKILKKDFKYLLLFILTSIFSAFVFLPNNSGSESLIIFDPLWLVNSMINSQDRLNWYRLTITLESGVSYKVFLAGILGVLVFIFGNFGTRMVGLISLREMFKERILSYILIFSIFFPLLFTQSGNGWNIVQFLYYGLFIMAIFAGITVGKIYKNFPKAVALGISVIIVLLTIPTTINTLEQYLPPRPPAKLSKLEIEGLNFLKNQEPGVVLSYPYEEKLKSYFSTPLPLSAYTSTAYVSGFSGHEGFFEDTINLEILGIDNRTRLNIAKEIFKNQSKSKELLVQNNIEYVYLPKNLKIEIDTNKMGLETIYENDEVRVYKVN